MNYRLSRNVEYALMALVYLSCQKNRTVSVREMVQQLHCPFDPLSKVLQKMSEKSWVSSQKGVRGGYVLLGDLKDHSLYDLMKVLLEPTEIVNCLSGHCDFLENCLIKAPLKELNDQFINFYKSLSLNEILFNHSAAWSMKQKKKNKTQEKRV